MKTSTVKGQHRSLEDLTAANIQAMLFDSVAHQHQQDGEVTELKKENKLLRTALSAVMGIFSLMENMNSNPKLQVSLRQSRYLKDEETGYEWSRFWVMSFLGEHVPVCIDVDQVDGGVLEKALAMVSEYGPVVYKTTKGYHVVTSSLLEREAAKEVYHALNEAGVIDEKYYCCAVGTRYGNWSVVQDVSARFGKKYKVADKVRLSAKSDSDPDHIKLMDLLVDVFSVIRKCGPSGEGEV
ncbi:MAG: hypothetical protein GY861_20730 [bacterium]|nr:hypothetical protein [bacterium]